MRGEYSVGSIYEHLSIKRVYNTGLLPQARALQLVRGGYKRVEDLAKANVQDLTANIAHLSRTAADHLISAARVRTSNYLVVFLK